MLNLENLKTAVSHFVSRMSCELETDIIACYYEKLINYSPLYIYRCFSNQAKIPVEKLPQPFIKIMMEKARKFHLPSAKSVIQKTAVNNIYEEGASNCWFHFPVEGILNEGLILLNTPSLVVYPHKDLQDFYTAITNLRQESGSLYPNYPWSEFIAFRGQLESILNQSLDNNGLKLIIISGKPIGGNRVIDLINCELGFGLRDRSIAKGSKKIEVFEKYDPIIFQKTQYCIMGSLIKIDEDKLEPGFMQIELPTLESVADNCVGVLKNALMETSAEIRIAPPCLTQVSADTKNELKSLFLKLHEPYDSLIIHLKQTRGILHSLSEDQIVKLVAPMVKVKTAVSREFLSKICEFIFKEFNVSAQFSSLINDQNGNIIGFDPITIRYTRSSCSIIRSMEVGCYLEDTKRFASAFEFTKNKPFSVYQYECPISNKICALKAITINSLEQDMNVIFSIGQYHINKVTLIPQKTTEKYKYVSQELIDLLKIEPVFTTDKLQLLHAIFILSTQIAEISLRLLLVPNLVVSPEIEGFFDYITKYLVNEYNKLCNNLKKPYFNIEVIEGRTNG